MDVPIDVQQDLHLYMCIRLSGYIEQLLHQAISAYVADLSSGPASDFALSWFRNAPNLTPDALERLIARFGDGWKGEIRDFLDEGENRSSLGTLITIRNNTAHGKSYSGSLSKISSYKELVDDLHEWVVDRMIA